VPSVACATLAAGVRLRTDRTGAAG